LWRGAGCSRGIRRVDSTYATEKRSYAQSSTEVFVGGLLGQKKTIRAGSTVFDVDNGVATKLEAEEYKIDNDVKPAAIHATQRTRESEENEQNVSQNNEEIPNYASAVGDGGVLAAIGETGTQIGVDENPKIQQNASKKRKTDGSSVTDEDV
jgi:hypothetical protein